MQGARKILRSLTIIACAAASCWLFFDAAVNGPGAYQLYVSGALMLGALGLVATWFWSPF
jgi:hypothetical protein